MKIKNVTINCFGKLKNYSLDLSNGMNVVYGENEYGKSTIMAFIKLMFYGKIKSNTLDDKKLREKYRPWNGSKMSGSITIEYKGKIYRIQKEISSKSASDDHTTIYNLSDGKTIKLAKSEEVGEYFLGVDSVGFERSSYIKNIGDIDFKVKSTRKVSKDTVLDKILSNLASGGEEDVSQSEVLARVKEAIKGLRTDTGRGGAIPKLDKEIESLELKVSRIKDFEKSQEGEKLKRKKLEVLIAEQKNIRSKIEKADNYKRMKEIEDVRKLVSERELLQKKALENGINPESCGDDLNFLEDCKRKLQEVELSIKHCNEISESSDKNFVEITKEEEDFFKEQANICDNLRNKPKDSDKVSSKMKELKFLKGEKSAQQNIIKKKFLGKSRSCIISGILFLVLSILAVIFNFFVFSMIFAGAFLVFGFVYLYFNSLMNKEQDALSKEIRDLDEKIDDLNLQIMSNAAGVNDFGEDYEIAYGKIKSLLQKKKCKDFNDFYQNRALTKEKEKYDNMLSECGERRADILESIYEYLGNRNIKIDLKNFKEYLESLRVYKEKYDDLNRQINYKSQVLGLEKADKKSLENLLNNFPVEDNPNIGEGNIEILRERLEKLNRMNLYDSYRESSEKIVKHPENLELLEIKLREMKTGKAKMANYYECLNLTKDVLEEAINEMKSNFNPRLNSRASEVFKLLTGGKYGRMRVDKDYKFVVEDNGIDRESDCFSSGTIDQAYLALRIAISELVSSERVPLLFDDTLMQYDDKRLDEVMKFLNDYSNKNDVQSIIFTCHRAVCGRVTTLKSNIEN